jgi:hypothetical protein
MVKKLSSRDFAERAAADKELLRLGPAALPALREGLKSGDAEVRSRCKGLVGRIEDIEWKHRVDAYAADVDGKQSHDLPLLKTYEKLVGSGLPARKLFAECLRTNGTLLQTATGERGPALEAFKKQCQVLYAPQKKGKKAVFKTGAGDLATLLLISAALKDESATLKDVGGGWERPSVADLFGNAGLDDAVKDRETGEAFRRLLTAWADTRSAANYRSRQYFLYFVQAAEFKEGLPVVQRWIRNKDSPKGTFLPMAISVYGKIGGKDAAAELEKLWGDETVLFMADKSGAKGRLGDQALAASIRLAGKDPKDYGMTGIELLLRRPGEQLIWSISTHWFSSDDARRAGLKKWRSEADKRK